MGFLFNSSGIITKGMGTDQRIVTQGYGGQFDVFVGKQFKKIKFYNFDLKIPLSKKEELNKKLKVPLKKETKHKLKITLPLKKTNQTTIQLNQPISKEKLSKILKLLKSI